MYFLICESTTKIRIRMRTNWDIARNILRGKRRCGTDESLLPPVGLLFRTERKATSCIQTKIVSVTWILETNYRIFFIFTGRETCAIFLDCNVIAANTQDGEECF